MARSPANAGSVAVIESPEDQGKIASVRIGADSRVGVGLDIDPDVVKGRSGGHRGGTEAVTTIGKLTFGEGGEAKVEGSLEEYNPREYFNQKTLGILRGFAGRLPDGAEARHYNQVLTALAEALVVDDATKEAYDRAFGDLQVRGSEEVAEGVLSFYRDQFRKSFQVIDGYVDDRPLERLSEDERTARVQQERALLLYSEFVLANIQVNSVSPERQSVGREFLENRLEAALAELDVSDEQRHALGFAFNALRNSGEFAFTRSCNNVVEHRTEYLRASDPDAVASGGVRLDAEFINDVHFVRANDHIEDAHRLIISALDRINEPARQRWIAAREQNPEVDISGTPTPFSDWQSRVEAKIAEREEAQRLMESKDYINGILGSRKEESGFFGIKRAHELKHHIKNVDHKAPIKRPGASRDALENVQAAEIAIMAGVWQGEWNQGATAKSGESHSKEFYQRVVDVTVWSVTLNSADAVANFLDQLEAADAMQMHGEVVGEVLGNQAEVANAQAFRVPVLNHRGEPSFLVVDRETFAQMIEVARTSRASYAKLAEKDDRYKVHSKEERHKAFRPQLKEHRATPEAWVDQERDFILAEELSLQRINALDATGNEVDAYNADQLRPALENYRRQLNDFQMNFCRESRYRELAVGRLATRGVAGNAPDFNRLLVQEMNAVAWEYANRWNAFKSVTTRLLELQSIRNGRPDAQLDADNIITAERDLLNFLANLDYELEIQTRAASTNIGEDAIRQVIPRRVLRSAREVTTIAPEPADPDFMVRWAQAEEEIEDILGRPLTPQEVVARATIPATEAGTPEVNEPITVEDLVTRASLVGVQGHDDSGYFWNAGGEKISALDSRGSLFWAVSKLTGVGVSGGIDSNSTRVAFVPVEDLNGVDNLPDLPNGHTAVAFQFHSRNMDSSHRSGFLEGVIVLPKSDATSLQQDIERTPNRLFELAVAINQGPLLAYDGTPLSIDKGDSVSLYTNGNIAQSARFGA